MMALVLLLLSFLAIGALFLYYLVIVMLMAASAVLMMMIGVSMLVSDNFGLLAGLFTFAILGGLTVYCAKTFYNATEETT